MFQGQYTTLDYNNNTDVFLDIVRVLIKGLEYENSDKNLKKISLII